MSQPTRPLADPVFQLELEEIQSEVLRGYNRQAGDRSPAHGAYLLVRFPPRNTDETRARVVSFLRAVREACPVTTAASWQEGQLSLNIGFTYEGMRRLIPPELARDESNEERPVADLLDAAGPAFRDLKATMADRSKQLGDLGPSHVDEWEFSDAPGSVHAILLLFGSSHDMVHDAVKDLRKLERDGIETQLHWGNELDERREHFGYVDGISQPSIDGGPQSDDAGYGTVQADKKWRGIKPGEFVLGYDDEEGPFGGQPFLKNGTFFVLRKIEQDVAGFHRYLKTAGAELEEFLPRDGESEEAKRDRVKQSKDWVASRLMGRHFDGEPLIGHGNDFRYARDQNGLGCPFGAHIRRANPRDVAGRISDRSERHRMIRRTLTYTEVGEPTENRDDTYERATHSLGYRLLNGVAVGRDELSLKRGMLFGCFNASIGRQFEVVQGGWLNAGESAPQRLFTLRDPIAGANHSGDAAFFVPRRPPIVLSKIAGYSITRGGGYFFIPGIAALDWLMDPRQWLQDTATTRAGRHAELRDPRRAAEPDPDFSDETLARLARQLLTDPRAQLAPSVPPGRLPALAATARRLFSLKTLELNTFTEPQPKPWAPRVKLGRRAKGTIEDRVLVFLGPIADLEAVEHKLAQTDRMDRALNAIEVDGASVLHHARFLVIKDLARFPTEKEEAEMKSRRLIRELLHGKAAAPVPYLFFAAWFDCRQSAFIDAMTRHAAALPFAHCHGFPTGIEPDSQSWWDRFRFRNFILWREQLVAFAYQAYPNSTEEIRQALQIREDFIRAVASRADADILDLFKSVNRPFNRNVRTDAQSSTLDATRSR